MYTIYMENFLSNEYESKTSLTHCQDIAQV